MSQIRACTREDMPHVAQLFQTIFRRLPGPAPASLQQYLPELFFDAPWHDPELPSLVYIRPDGAVRGFVGVIPLHMSLGDKPVRAALASSIMVESPKDDPFAGARLLRAFLNGPQDLSFSDDANHTSVVMWKKLGGQSLPAESLEWLRVLRPAGFALSMARARIPLLALAHPVCRAIDGTAARFARNPFRLQPQATMRTVEVDLNDASLVDCLRGFAGAYSLRPAWEKESLQWLLNHAAKNRRHGSLVGVAVYGKGTLPLGCYLYYSRPHGVARVLQFMASPDSAGPVLDSLLEHAYRNQCVGVRGRAQGRYLDGLFSRDCIFLNRGSVVVHSRHAELVEAARSGDALMTGLAGEAWTRIAGGDVFN